VPKPPRPTPRSLRGPLGALTGTALAVVLTACTHTVRVGSGHTLAVALNEYRINPGSASAPSGVLTLVVRNYGRLSHNLVVASDGYDDGSTPAIPPGSEATLLVDLTPGVYTIYSSILNDDALGVHGTLKVTYN
jgi:hypothetical protein